MPARARVLFEPPNLLERVMPESVDVHRRDGPAQLAGEQQQRTRGAHERVQADAEQLARRLGDRLGVVRTTGPPRAAPALPHPACPRQAAVEASSRPAC